MLNTTVRLALILCLLAGMFAMVPARPAYAASIVVNTATDGEANDGSCTLREAIIAANTNAAYWGCVAGIGADEISFAADYTITLASQLPDVTSAVTITGRGQANTVIRANASVGVASYRIFSVSGSGNSLALNNLSLANGRCAGSCSVPSTTGGAIVVEAASLSLTNVTITGSRATNYAGAIYVHSGTLTVSGSTFIDNRASSNGGTIYNSLSQMTISSSTFSENVGEASNAYGGAIYNSSMSATSITGSTFSTNSAAYGGAISNSTGVLTISNSIFSDNAAASLGGALYNQGSGGLQISTTTFISNYVTVNAMNTGGGAIYNRDTGGIVNISESSFNTNDGYFGGAVYNNAPGMAITRSTFSGNTSDSIGGAVYNTAFLNLSNSTLSANQSGAGGAVYNLSSGTLYLSHDTMSGNQGTYTGGALLNQGTVHIGNSILANSVGSADCYNENGTIASNVTSLIETNATDPNACGTFAIVGEPLLGALADNGGSTQTMKLLPYSPAIDTASIDQCHTTDQRGVSRVQGPACDIGAFELEQSDIMVSSQASKDGWILESTEASSVGGTRNYGATLFYVGDSAMDQQYRSILSFNTSSLPAGAVITGIHLQVRKEGMVGTNPFNTHGNLKVDMRNTYFGSTSELQLADFKAVATLPNAGIFSKPPLYSWYTAMLPASAGAHINRTGITQFRLRFASDDNDDMNADYVKFYSGNSSTYKPVLIIFYYVAP